MRLKGFDYSIVVSWFDNLKTPKIKEKPPEKLTGKAGKVPDGLWVKCTKCGEILQAKSLKDNSHVCSECGFHFRMNAWDRIYIHVRQDSFQEFDAKLRSNDPLKFNDTKPYSDRLSSAQKNTELSDALVTGKGKIEDQDVVIAAFEFKFMGGSMGAVVGEKLTRAFEAAIELNLPAVVFSSSGGARMQEGILSLMQMAKTSSLVGMMKQKGIPYISVLSDPTTGGVAASFAMLGDVIIAEPGALIGFAGPRVIQQTIRQELPEGFQRAEYLLKHGFVDRIVHRKEMSSTIAKLIRIFMQKK